MRHSQMQGDIVDSRGEGNRGVWCPLQTALDATDEQLRHGIVDLIFEKTIRTAAVADHLHIDKSPTCQVFSTRFQCCLEPRVIGQRIPAVDQLIQNLLSKL